MFSYLGYGVGLRPYYYKTILETLPAVDWFEVMTEDYLGLGGRPLDILTRIRGHYPIALHGVSLSIGGSDPLNMDYLKKVKNLYEYIHPAWISDHLGWSGVNGINTHDLLPLPYTEEAVHHIAKRVQKVQEFFGFQILLENVVNYISYSHSCLTECDFISAIAEEADCLILLDINNLYINALNQELDPIKYLDSLLKNRVQQFHMGGHEKHSEYIIDSHDEPIVPAVWELYKEALKRFQFFSLCIERDANFPPFIDLLSELEHARDITEKYIGK